MGNTWYSRVSYRFAPLPHNMSIEEAGNQLFSFVFVRHPFARLVSSYQDKIVRAKTQKRNHFLGFSCKDLNYFCSSQPTYHQHF